uniref:Uncharacterized protein n=1 Tax=Peronospora matthiolae TaxID=2874970 RepID=A0AAV1U1G6_9STRA
MVTQQAGDNDLQNADTVVAREGTVNGDGSTQLDETNLSSKRNDREIETEIAMRRDHGTEREEQDNRLSSLDLNLADNRAGLDRSEATQRSEEDKPSKIDEADSAEAPVYYHESGDSFAKDIEQHLVVLPEMSTSTDGVTMNDVQIGDPDVPLTADQQRLISSIWKSRHYLMGRATLYHQRHEGRLVISMSVEPQQLRKESVRSHPNIWRSCQISSKDCQQPRSFSHPRHLVRLR